MKHLAWYEARQCEAFSSAMVGLEEAEPSIDWQVHPDKEMWIISCRRTWLRQRVIWVFDGTIFSQDMEGNLMGKVRHASATIKRAFRSALQS